MAGMSKRVEKLRKTVIEAQPEICIERARIITDVYRKHEDMPIDIKRAKMVEEVLGNMSIYIEDGEMIVGNQAYKTRTAPIFPEYSWDWIYNEIDEFEKRDGDRFYLKEEYKDELREILQFWKGKTLKDRVYQTQTQDVLKDKKYVGVLGWEGNVTAGDGHIIPDYEMILDLGFGGLKNKAEDKLRNLDDTDPDDLRQRKFLQAVIITTESCTKFIKRYADLAEELISKTDIVAKKNELEKIHMVCKNIAVKPPGNLYEAIQLVYFVHLILQIESNGHSMSLGRVDQYLYKYYKNDIDSGIIDKEFAKELMDCFYIKIFSIIKLRPWSHTKFVAGYPTYQNIIVGGQDVDGNDQTNELTYLMLESLGDIKLSEPNFYVRIHKNSPEKLLRMCVDIIKEGFGMPALVNDEVIIPSLILRGVEKEDAYNYATMGCLEVQVPGKWGYRANGKSKLNLLKVLELALNNGVDARSGIQLENGLGSLDDFTSFEMVMKAWEKQLKYFTRLHVTADNINDLAMEELVPDILCSALVQDCIGRGKTIKEGGAIYDMISGCQVGVPNVGNSLYAIKKLCFDEKKITLSDLKKALDNDFDGVEGEKIRQILLNHAEKYGNDIDEVDNLTKEAYDIFIKDIVKYKNTRYGRGPKGGIFMPATVTISANVPCGKACGASADGRKANQPTADGVSPMHGTEKFGPTAVFNSVSKLSTLLTTGGQLLNMRFQPNILKNDSDTNKLIELIKTFFSKMGWHVQFNIISTDVLKKAQENPEEYRDLVVRVAGYSALFTALDPIQQQDIISRSEYYL